MCPWTDPGRPDSSRHTQCSCLLAIYTSYHQELRALQNSWQLLSATRTYSGTGTISASCSTSDIESDACPDPISQHISDLTNMIIYDIVTSLTPHHA